MSELPDFSLPSSEFGRGVSATTSEIDSTTCSTVNSGACSRTETREETWNTLINKPIPEAIAPGNIIEEIMFSEKTSVMSRDVVHSSEYACVNSPDIRKLSDDFDSTDSEFTAENVIAADERLRVTPCTSQPYRWICYLEITTVTGLTYKGTGFFNTMLGPGKPGLILTCAHNLYIHNHGGYAKKIRVYPGRDMGNTPYGHFTVYPECFKVPDAWLESKSPEYDYGALFVTDPNLIPKAVYGFGYRLLDDSDLEKRVITIAGYPGDKPDGTLWVAGGTIGRVLPYAVHYDNDTEGGQSGSPVWTWDKYNWMVVGIHGYGGSMRNSARRLTADLVRQVYAWSEDLPTATSDRHSMTSFRSSSYRWMRITSRSGRETTV
ncbi:uncharacterized protein LOC106159115 isoform X2 [Lingula anatina]|nr:uncharacterized protein LOC106159114 isoform X2 [Lingula anatina]XP_013390760.1 uncharacterized protein LOC106159115 isoform X2 [Lingula anatina]XP_023932669.1 uncharacterized protein LOC106159115 isoform X2 [Lingula anatina]|eukprot:XP_013390759.1 uncharacterized protein LOC106159114 isoform X2 [Lingula anatina]